MGSRDRGRGFEVIAFAVNDAERHFADISGHKYQEYY